MAKKSGVSGDDLVPLEWCDGKEETVDQWGQRQWDSGLRTGRKNGIKAAACRLREIAAELFMKDKEEASIVKQLAKEIEKLN